MFRSVLVRCACRTSDGQGGAAVTVVAEFKMRLDSSVVGTEKDSVSSIGMSGQKNQPGA